MVTTKIGGKLMLNGKQYKGSYKVRANLVDLDKEEYLDSSGAEKDVRQGKDVTILQGKNPVTTLIAKCKKIQEGKWVDSTNGRFPQTVITSDGTVEGMITFEVDIDGNLLTPKDVVKHIDIETNGLALHVQE